MSFKRIRRNDAYRCLHRISPRQMILVGVSGAKYYGTITAGQTVASFTSPENGNK